VKNDQSHVNQHKKFLEIDKKERFEFDDNPHDEDLENYMDSL